MVIRCCIELDQQLALLQILWLRQRHILQHGIVLVCRFRASHRRSLLHDDCAGSSGKFWGHFQEGCEVHKCREAHLCVRNRPGTMRPVGDRRTLPIRMTTANETLMSRPMEDSPGLRFWFEGTLEEERKLRYVWLLNAFCARRLRNRVDEHRARSRWARTAL